MLLEMGLGLLFLMLFCLAVVCLIVGLELIRMGIAEDTIILVFCGILFAIGIGIIVILVACLLGCS